MAGWNKKERNVSKGIWQNWWGLDEFDSKLNGKSLADFSLGNDIT